MTIRSFPHAVIPPSCTWLSELAQLVQRFSHYNVDADLAAMSVPELWGLYLRLRRLAGD